MASGSLRREVLNSFKKIHRTRCSVFKNDDKTLKLAREEINKHYKENKSITDQDKIKELIKFAHEVIEELKTSVLQFEQKANGNFQANIRPEMFENQDNKKANKSSKRR